MTKLYELPLAGPISSGDWLLVSQSGHSRKVSALAVAGPQGEQGPQGPAGPVGATGPQGEPADPAESIHAATAKSTPADSDELGISDSAASWGLKKLTFANLKAWISSLGGAGISNTPSGNIAATTVQEAINELDTEKVSKAGDNITGNLNVSGLILSTGGTIGYSTGAGGTVTQATSKTTGVAINKPSGRITMHNAALAAGASVVFAVFNSTVAGHSILLSGEYNTVDPSSYRIELAYSGAGQFAIRVTNITAGSLSQALDINFCIIFRSLV